MSETSAKCQDCTRKFHEILARAVELPSPDKVVQHPSRALREMWIEARTLKDRYMAALGAACDSHDSESSTVKPVFFRKDVPDI